MILTGEFSHGANWPAERCNLKWQQLEDVGRLRGPRTPECKKELGLPHPQGDKVSLSFDVLDGGGRRAPRIIRRARFCTLSNSLRQDDNAVTYIGAPQSCRERMREVQLSEYGPRGPPLR